MESTKRTPRTPFKRPTVPKATKQSNEDTEQADGLTSGLYEALEKSRGSLLSYIQGFMTEHGDKFINVRDSTGNCLIHNLCMGLADTKEDSILLEEVMTYLLKSAVVNHDDLQVMAVQNFMSGLPISKEDKLKELQNLGITESTPQHTSIIKVNQVNSFGQTALHILAAQKKLTLLFKYLEVVHKNQPSDHAVTGFNLNQGESTQRTFMQIMLEKGFLKEFEAIARTYSSLLDLRGKDANSNSCLMTYKHLKGEQLKKLKNEGLYKEYVQAIKDADLTAYRDLRNILFDRELGTNILTEFLKGKTLDFKTLILIIREIREQITTIPDLIESLTTIPHTQGSSISMKIIQKGQFAHIQEYITEIVGLDKLRVMTNTVSGENTLHCIMKNMRLKQSEKIQLAKSFNDESLLNKPDAQGILPINIMIETWTDFNEVQDSDDLNWIASSTNLKQFQDNTAYQQQREQHSADIGKLSELRKELAEFKNKRIPKECSDEVEGEQDEREFRQHWFKKKLEKQQKLLKDYNSGMLKQPINPLETAIKCLQATISRILVSHWGLSPLALSSDFKHTLLELASQQHKSEVFESMIEVLKSVTDTTMLHKPVQTFIQMYKQVSVNYKGDIGQVFSRLETIIFGADCQKLREIVIDELANSEEALISPTLTDFQKIANQKPSEVLNATTLALQAGQVGYYQLAKRLIDIIDFTDKSEVKRELYFEILKDRLCRHDTDSVTSILKNLSDFQVTLEKLTSDQQAMLTQAMYHNYKDIMDVRSLEFINKELGYDFIPIISEEKPVVIEKVKTKKISSKPLRNLRYQCLNSPQQIELLQTLLQNAFKFVIDEIKRCETSKLPVKVELNQALDEYLKGKNKHLYLQQLIESQALFSILDIRREAQQETIGNFIVQSLKQSNLSLALKVMQQLKDYLIANCSAYPVDYHAEVSQFERNYPYREFKIDNMIRKMNLRGDRYPMFLGQMDSGEVDDDQEEYLNTVWNEMLQSQKPLDSARFPSYPNSTYEQVKKKDEFIPNGNAILFKVFASHNPVHIHATPENQKQITDLFNFVFEFGGFPLVDLPNDSKVPYEVMRLSKLTAKFNQCIKSGHFQNILHQIAYDDTSDNTELLMKLSANGSLQRENLNCRDRQGNTPVANAIEHSNYTFLKAIEENKGIYLRDDIAQIIQKVFSQQTTPDKMELKISLLEFISKNVLNMSYDQQRALQASCKRTVTEFIDLIYGCQEYSSDYLPKNSLQVFTQLETKEEVFKNFNKQLLETYKLMRHKVSSSGNPLQSIVSYRLISPQFQLGKILTSLGTDITLEQVKQLERAGYDICNFICPAFSIIKSHKQLSKYTAFFPFKDPQYYYSYALKNAIQHQPQNRELVNYLVSKQASNIWKPFQFEIMLLIGEAYGTQDPLFVKMFDQDQCHLMGKYLTVESRIKFFKDSILPMYAALYYTEDSYKKMLITLADLLIKHNEHERFETFICKQQAKFYLCDELISRCLETCCRWFRPRMALILASQCINEEVEYKFVDQSNLLPERSAVVTMKDIRETSMIAKCLDKSFTPQSLVTKLSRDMLDDYMKLILETNSLNAWFNFDEKERVSEQQKFLEELYFKMSPKHFPQLIQSLFDLCKTEKGTFRLVKALLELPSSDYYHGNPHNFSNKHPIKRKQEIKQYMLGKVDKWAVESHYYKILADPSRAGELASLLNLDKKDLEEIKQRVIEIKSDLNSIDNKEFVFGEMQTLIGVYKVKNDQGAAAGKPTEKKAPVINRNAQSSLSQLQKTSVQEVRQMTREEIKTKGENLVHLWEYLHREEKRRSGSTFARDNRSANVITDQELRKLMMNSRPQSINMETVFTMQDTAIFNNELECILSQQKFNTVTSLIPETYLNQRKDLIKISNRLRRNQSAVPSHLHAPVVLPFFLSLLKNHLQPLLFTEITNKQPEEEKKHDNNADPYGMENDEDDESLTEIINARSFVFEFIKNGLNSPANESQKTDSLRVLKEFMDIGDYMKIFQLKINISEYTYLQLVLDPLKDVLINPTAYEVLRETFFLNLVNEMQSLISIEHENSQQRIVGLYQNVCLPIFNSQLNDEFDFRIRKMILLNPLILKKMPNDIKQLVFVLLASISTTQNDQLLLLMREAMKGVRLSMYRNMDFIGRIQGLKHKNINIEDQVIYLCKCKRFTVIQEYAKNHDTISKPQIMAVLANSADYDILRWALQAFDRQENLDFLGAIIQDASGLAQLQIIDSILGQGKLLGNYIEFMKNQEIADLASENEEGNDSSTKSLLHDLIRLGQYKGVKAIREIATDDQWEYLKSFKSFAMESKLRVVDEGESGDEGGVPVEEQKEESIAESKKHSKVRPFFLALGFSQFELCELLMLSKQDIQGTLTKIEMQMLVDALESVNVMSCQPSRMGADVNPTIAKFNELVYPFISKSTETYRFSIAKLILQFPKILHFLYFTPKQYDHDLLSIANRSVRKDLGKSVEVDAFYLKCGLSGKVADFKADLGNLPHYLSSQEKMFYNLENGMDLNLYFSKLDKRIAIQKDEFSKPYTTFQKIGLFKKNNMKISNGEDIFNYKVIETILHDVGGIILELHSKILSEFFSSLDKYVLTAIATQQFALTYWLLDIQAAYNVQPDLKFETFKNCLWSMHFDSLSHDMIIFCLFSMIFPKENVYYAQLRSSDKEPFSFYHPNEDKMPIAGTVKPRFLATLLTLFNTSAKEDGTFLLVKGMEGKSLPDPNTFCEVLKFYLRNQAKMLDNKQIYKGTSEYTSFVTLLRTVSEAIRIYDSILEQDHFNKLCLSFGFTIDPNFLKHNVKDKDLYQAILSFMNFETSQYQHYFNFSLCFTNLEQQFPPHTPNTQYPLTVSLLTFLTQNLYHLLECFESTYHHIVCPTEAMIAIDDKKRITFIIKVGQQFSFEPNEGEDGGLTVRCGMEHIVNEEVTEKEVTKIIQSLKNVIIEKEKKEAEKAEQLKVQAAAAEEKKEIEVKKEAEVAAVEEKQD